MNEGSLETAGEADQYSSGKSWSINAIIRPGVMAGNKMQP